MPINALSIARQAGCHRPHASSAERSPALPQLAGRIQGGWGRPAGIATSAAAGPAPQTMSPRVTSDTDVGEAIRAACAELRKPFPEAAVAALQAEWFNTAGELAALPDDTARSLGVPLRLKHAVADMLGGVGSAAAAEAAPLLALPGSGNGSDAVQPQTEQQRAAADATAEAVVASSLAEVVTATVEGSGREAVAWDQSHLPIEQRQMPRYRGNSSNSVPKVSKRTTSTKYALSEDEMTAALKAKFEAFHRFLTVRFFGAQADPISEVTARKYQDHVRGMLGWLHRERGVLLGALSFSAAVPSSGREGVSLLFDYLLWLSNVRGISVRTEGIVIRAAAAAAKFLYHDQSKVNPGRGDRPYSDLDVIKELRAMSNTATKQAKVAPRTSDEELKWLSWPEFLQLCGVLRRECAALDVTGKRRSDAAVAWSLQRYLIFAIFSCVPDRQRTLRELEVGRTLVRDREGRWVIRHGAADYKTGRAYGERPPLQISPHIYPELEAYMGTWRAALKPRHNLLFTQRNGEPLTDKSLYKLVWTTAWRLTGKKCNPHLVRDSVVTYLRGSGASERELEALALYMGHSITMQRDTYDRRTKEQKVGPAVELLAQLNAQAMVGGGTTSASSGSDSEA